MRVSFHTFGCKCNLYDSNQIAIGLSGQDFELVEGEIASDVHVINTCTVTSSADAQARSLIRRIARKNRGSLIVITGCSIRRDLQEYEDVVASIEDDNKFIIIDNFKENVADLILSELNYKPKDGIVKPVFRTRAFVKITDGCSNFCSYCIVPFVRGEERSRNIDEVLSETKELERAGVREVVLTGINLGDYSFGLEDLIEKTLKSTSNLRLRLSSLRPSKITDHLLDIMKDKRICPHLHLSLQSASNKVLKLMNRLDYKAEDFIRVTKEISKKLRERTPFIAADIIIGFPGEGEEEFQETFKVLKESYINKLHVFVFSPRPETKAYSMECKIDESIHSRRNTLLEFSSKRYIDSLKGMKGKVVEVLWEKEGVGHTENYYPVEGIGAANELNTYNVSGFSADRLCLTVES